MDIAEESIQLPSFTLCYENVKQQEDWVLSVLPKHYSQVCHGPQGFHSTGEAGEESLVLYRTEFHFCAFICLFPWGSYWNSCFLALVWAIAETQFLPLAWRRWLQQVWKGRWQTWIYPTMEQSLSPWVVSGTECGTCRAVFRSSVGKNHALQLALLNSVGSSSCPHPDLVGQPSPQVERIKQDLRERNIQKSSKPTFAIESSAMLTSALLFLTSVWSHFFHTLVGTELGWEKTWSITKH